MDKLGIVTTEPDSPQPSIGLRDADDAKVTPAVRAAAAWTWRLLLIGVGVVVLGWLFKRYEDVTFPITLALLFTAMLRPLVEWSVRKGVPRVVAVLGWVLLTLLAVLGLLAFVVQQAISGGPQLVSEFTSTVDDVRNWLIDSPLHFDDARLSELAGEMVHWAQSHESSLAVSAVSTLEFMGRIGTGVLLTIFLLIFFLYDGPRIWGYVTRLVPSANRDHVRGATAAGFTTLESYVRATVIVAAVDAVIIGIGLAILKVPLVLPLVAVIFLGAFIPIVGSFAAGTLAVLVALTTQGWLNALIVLGILVFVMAFEGHILQPFVLGHSVRLHPVAIILAIGMGLMLAGIIGGLLAVPFVAFLDTALRWRPGKTEYDEPRKDSRLTAWVRRVILRGWRSPSTVPPTPEPPAPTPA